MKNDFRIHLTFGALILFFFSSAKIITSDYLQVNNISDKLNSVEINGTEADFGFRSDPIQSYSLNRPRLSGEPVECEDDGACFSWSTNSLPQSYVWDTSCPGHPTLGRYYWAVYKDGTFVTEITTPGPSVNVCIDDTDAPYDVSVRVRADNCHFYSVWSDESETGTVLPPGQGPCN